MRTRDYRRMGSEAYFPGATSVDAADLNPYLKERRSWHAKNVLAQYWREGWDKAKQQYANAETMRERNETQCAEDAGYLRDLAERIMRIPVLHGVDQGDTDRLTQIAASIENGAY